MAFANSYYKPVQTQVERGPQKSAPGKEKCS